MICYPIAFVPQRNNPGRFTALQLFMNPIRFFFFILFSFVFVAARAQTADLDKNKSLPEIEIELAELANEILNNDSTTHKFDLNIIFVSKMTHVLRRPESYSYPFDSLKTISILKSADGAFRVFTWYIVDKPKDSYYTDNSHYYFGMVQRRFVTATGEIQFLVIPLLEFDNIPKGFENLVTDNRTWFGALYYQAKFTDYVPAYDGYYYKLIPKEKAEMIKTGEKATILTYTPGKYRSRSFKEINGVQLSTHTREKQKIRYYVLMGWNGWNNKSNYKVFEIMSFDPEDSSRIIFGAPIIHFERIPKARAMFKYGENSSFTLNTGYIRTGLFGMAKKKMYVFDHLALPSRAREGEMFGYGPDGTFDGIKFSKGYGGYFEVYQNIEPDYKMNRKKERQHFKEILEKQEMTELDSLEELSNKAGTGKSNRENLREFQKQRKAEEKRLKDAGLNIPKGGEGKKEEE